MVNRIWKGHFGAGIVRTPDNFGRLGDRAKPPGACSNGWPNAFCRKRLVDQVDAPVDHAIERVSDVGHRL